MNRMLKVGFLAAAVVVAGVSSAIASPLFYSNGSGDANSAIGDLAYGTPALNVSGNAHLQINSGFSYFALPAGIGGPNTTTYFSIISGPGKDGSRTDLGVSESSPFEDGEFVVVGTRAYYGEGDTFFQSGKAWLYTPEHGDQLGGTYDNSANNLFVLKIVQGADSRTYSVYSNPATSAGEPGTADITWTVAGTRPVAALRVGSPWNAGRAFDEIRVGTTYADVVPVPEPASLATLALGAIGIMARRRKA